MCLYDEKKGEGGGGGRDRMDHTENDCVSVPADLDGLMDELTMKGRMLNEWKEPRTTEPVDG